MRMRHLVPVLACGCLSAGMLMPMNGHAQAATAPAEASVRNALGIVPRPRKVEAAPGVKPFVLTRETRIVAGSEKERAEAATLRDFLAVPTGWTLGLAEADASASREAGGAIELRIVSAPTMVRGAYTLTVEPAGVKIQAILWRDGLRPVRWLEDGRLGGRPSIKIARLPPRK